MWVVKPSCGKAVQQLRGCRYGVETVQVGDEDPLPQKRDPRRYLRVYKR